MRRNKSRCSVSISSGTEPWGTVRKTGAHFFARCFIYSDRVHRQAPPIFPFSIAPADGGSLLSSMNNEPAPGPSRICMHRKRVNISTVLAGQRLGTKEVDDGIWIVSFMSYDLGYIDLEQKTLRPLDNPFGPRSSPMS
jgi:hypothetical protein